MKTTPRRKRPARQSCVFRGRFVREQIDPRVKVLWERTTKKPAPFGRLRMNFQREHCRAINPYGGECPYREEECGLAFLAAVQNSLLPWIEDPAAYFVKVARASGVDRADRKPLTREMHREEGSGHPGDARSGNQAGHVGSSGLAGGSGLAQARPAPVVLEETSLRRSHARPESIGNLLGSINLGTRQDGSTDGSQSTK